MPPPPPEPAPERKQHPVVAGLIALVGVGLAIGLLAGGATLVATRVMGLGAETTATDSTARQSMYLPKPEATTASAASSLPTLPAASEPTGPVLTTPTKDTGITLTAAQTTVGQMGRIDLTGTYPTGEGAVLQVQRASGPGDDSWVDFPVSVTVSGGQFSTYVQTGRTGPNRFRVIDTDSDQASNEVTITVQ
ncbi:hypothetical protein ISU07_01115 [Nocardioides islandensis]|uniref:Uncharacterized protein n=1 Tax=Nocardioides islandensis TaxID=433663 RepID=A0A930YCI7_9ACTN|nr:hypothetical protein [Nocardioides islandensis]MBF4761712.1 hypothetical protein [Nocardioides islandensis]